MAAEGLEMIGKGSPLPPGRRSRAFSLNCAAAVLAVTAAFTLVLGILPGAFLDIAKDATFLIR